MNRKIKREAVDIHPAVRVKMDYAWNLFCRKGGNSLSQDQLRGILEGFGIGHEPHKVKEIYKQLGKEDADFIDYLQFQQIMSTRLFPPDHQVELKKSFALLTTSQKISLDDLRLLARKVGYPVSEEKLKLMIEKGDLDNDAGWKFEQFCNIVLMKEPEEAQDG